MLKIYKDFVEITIDCRKEFDNLVEFLTILTSPQHIL